ncbi:hypothetical protein NLG97_g2946 [Lecanicillium saksenae]|uniref:Uncharacterized protein n=1 Tax=Lecanicillium saksenae TaxID=468837 RepID=A0ACC1R2R4_9HYPO|nr:hypothetical protein NLG97_g2946 [Lecanicillium saksenae]
MRPFTVFTLLLASASAAPASTPIRRDGLLDVNVEDTKVDTYVKANTNVNDNTIASPILRRDGLLDVNVEDTKVDTYVKANTNVNDNTIADPLLRI